MGSAPSIHPQMTIHSPSSSTSKDHNWLWMRPGLPEKTGAGTASHPLNSPQPLRGQLFLCWVPSPAAPVSNLTAAVPGTEKTLSGLNRKHHPLMVTGHHVPFKMWAGRYSGGMCTALCCPALEINRGQVSMAASLAPFVSNKIYSKLFKLFYK